MSVTTYRLVALAVADVVNDVHGYEFWMRMSALCRKTGAARDTVKRALQAMVALGVIEVVAETPGAPTRYRWLLLHQQEGRGDTATPPRGETAGGPRRHRGGVRGDTATNNQSANQTEPKDRDTDVSRGTGNEVDTIASGPTGVAVAEVVTPMQVAKAVLDAWWEHVQALTGHAPAGVNYIGLARILERFVRAGWTVPEVKHAMAAAYADAAPFTASVLEAYLDGRRGPGGRRPQPRRTAPGADRLREMLAEAQRRQGGAQ